MGKKVRSLGFGAAEFGEGPYGGLLPSSVKDDVLLEADHRNEYTRLKSLVDKKFYYGNIVVPSSMAWFNKEFFEKMKPNLYSREEEIYLVRYHEVVWANHSALSTTPDAIGLRCHDVFTTPSGFCDRIGCHHLRKPFMARDGGRTTMFYPYDQAVRGVVVLKPKGSLQNGNHSRPMLATAQDKAWSDPQRAGDSCVP